MTQAADTTNVMMVNKQAGGSQTGSSRRYSAVNTIRIHHVKAISSALGMILGAMAIIFAAISFATNMQLSDILSWMNKYFGITFTLLFTALLLVAIYAIVKINQRQSVIFFAQVGAQAANGISTLALTFTLLGISLGIGALAEQSLTPQNVNAIISALTTQFSMAFMTTVVGLPVSTAVRACLSILLAKQDSEEVDNTVEGVRL